MTPGLNGVMFYVHADVTGCKAVRVVALIGPLLIDNNKDSSDSVNHGPCLAADG